MNKTKTSNGSSKWRSKLHEVIFEADTPTGKIFDVTLLIVIVISVFVVILDSVASLNARFGLAFYYAEWFFTILFTLEYLLRIITTKYPSKYIFSFYGIIDLLAILPTYLSLILTGTQFFVVIRMLRLLRVFRVLKLARYVGASAVLAIALRNSRHKIVVFLEVVIT